jgi:hypothetical protein
MATAIEKFIQLKEQAQQGYISLSLENFGDEFSKIHGLFRDLKFDLANINIVSETEQILKLKAFSKNFLFGKDIFKNNEIVLEFEFSLVNDQLEIFAICKFNKDPKKFSKLPGIIGDLLKPLDFLSIKDIGFILTSKNVTLLKSTTFPMYDNKSVNFKPGINLAGFIDLKKSGDIANLITQPLEPIIGAGPYFMSWNLKDKLDIDFSLDIPQDIEIENIFNIKEPTLVIKPVTPVEISLDGIFELDFPATPPISIDGGFTYQTDSIRGKFNLDHIAKDIPSPFGLLGMHLSTLSVEAGITNGIPIVGAEGTFYIGPNEPAEIEGANKLGGIRSNEFKVIYTAVPGKITPTFAYLYLDKITIEDFIEAVSNQDVELPAFLNSIGMEQVMFHWCENPLGESKPDGTIAYPVFGLSSITNILGHKTFTEINVTTEGESSGTLIAAPIDLGNGLLKITGNGEGTPEAYKGATKVKPGGMVMSFNSLGNPAYFSFSTKIEILGITGEAEGSISDNGLTAKLKSDIAGIIKNQIELTYDKQYFEVKTDIYAGISGLKVDLGKLGSIKLDTFLEGGFSAKYLDGIYTNKMRLHFMVVGVNFDLGELEIEILDLNMIVRTLEDKIKDVIQKLGEDVFAWLTATIEGIIVFIGEKLDEIGKALNNHFKEGLKEAVVLMKEVGYQAKEVGKALNEGYENSKEELAKALKEAGYLAEEVGEVLSDILGLSGELTAEILKGIGNSAEEIARTLKTVYGFTTAQIGQAMKTLEFSAEAVSEVLNIIKAPVEEVHKVLTEIFNKPDKVARDVLNAAGYPVKVITENLPFVKLPSVFGKLPPVFGKLPPIFGKLPFGKLW